MWSLMSSVQHTNHRDSHQQQTYKEDRDVGVSPWRTGQVAQVEDRRVIRAGASLGVGG